MNNAILHYLFIIFYNKHRDLSAFVSAITLTYLPNFKMNFAKSQWTNGLRIDHSIRIRTIQSRQNYSLIIFE